MLRTTRSMVLFAAFALAALCGPALAQDYPTKPITLIVPWPAGGTTDLVMRALATATEKHLGQSVTIENRPGAAGTLGPSVMANYDMEIDPAHNKVNLYSQNHCPGEVVYWTRSPYAAIPMRLDSFLHIILPVDLDGHTFEALIDTGSSHSWLLYDLAKGPFGWTDDTKELAPATDAGAGPGWYHYPFRSLSLNGVDIRNPRIDVHKGSGSAADRPTLVIGMDVLSKLRTFISYSEHMLYFTPANAPPPDEVERPMAATRAVPE